MTYDPQTYWTAAGRDRENTEHESHFVRTPVFAHQEERLMALLRTLEFRSVLEVGCGWGRITKLVHDEWPDVSYVAFDLSAERVASARKKAPDVTFLTGNLARIEDFDPGYDLVLAVETLMHVRPEQIEATVQKLCRWSSKYVVSLDWAVPLDVPIADHNFLHDYVSLYGDRLVRMEQIGLQYIHVAEVESLPSQRGPHTTPSVSGADTDPALRTRGPLEVAQVHQRDVVDVQEPAPRVVAAAKRRGAKPALSRDKGEGVDLHRAGER